MSSSLAITAPLDPGFQPPAIFHRCYAEATLASGNAVPLVIGLERECGRRSRFETLVRPGVDPETMQHVERIVKFLLWSRGGWRLHIGGPQSIGEYIRGCFDPVGSRAFDVQVMSRVYERPFEVLVTNAESVPAAHEVSTPLGGHLNGCRIGFDLGASDYKIAAIQDGELVYSREFPWNPKGKPDPKYHYEHLKHGLSQAAARLPHVDTIGGCSAGVILGNRIMVGSLFRSVPPAKFEQAKNLFNRLQEEWRIPLEVANDGDVAALAGAMSLDTTGVLGIAMGSSQAGGYIGPVGGMTGWLNELAFTPVDYNPAAAADEWSGDHGIGAQYFSQQAVGRLLPAAEISLPKELGLPEQLQEVQSLISKDDPRAVGIYETLGVYLGYTIPHYADFYEFKHVLLLGRVTSGRGGDILVAKARGVLRAEFPDVAARVTIHVPDEKGRRIGQAVAAASLPALPN